MNSQIQIVFIVFILIDNKNTGLTGINNILTYMKAVQLFIAEWQYIIIKMEFVYFLSSF